jgi:hypothetical protein
MLPKISMTSNAMMYFSVRIALLGRGAGPKKMPKFTELLSTMKSKENKT